MAMEGHLNRTNEITDEYVIKYFYASNDRIYGRRLIALERTHEPKELYDYLINRFDDSESIRETIIRIRCNVKEHPKCPICGKPVLFMGKRKRMFLNTCSLQCGFKLRQKHNEEFWYKKEGVNNAFAAEDSKKKIKKTKKEKHGDENFNNNPKTVITCLIRYGTTNGGGIPQAIEKSKETQRKKYNGKLANQTKEIKAKIKNTKKEKYGDENYVGRETYINTCLIKYGEENAGSRLRGTHISEERKQHLRDMSDLIQEKRYNTMKANNSFIKSKIQDDTYNELRKYFDEEDILKEHKTEKYPYKCDFYIKSIDTYIEVQGSQFHNHHPFNKENKNDIEELNKLLVKSKLNPKSQATGIVNTWTITDIQKRNLAKENNLNYIEIWPKDSIETIIRCLAKENNLI